MIILRRTLPGLLLPLLLLGAGCRTPQSPDPYGHSGQSPFARLAPKGPDAGNAHAGKRSATATGDPFLASTRDVDVEKLGRATLSDTTLDDLQARDAAYLAGEAVDWAGQEIVPSGARDPEAAASEGAVNRLLHSQRSEDVLDEATVHRRLRQLELELQLTDDHAKQDQLALEIARLRKQLSNSGP